VKSPVFQWVCATDNGGRRFTEVAGPPYAASGDHPRESELSKIRTLLEMEHNDRERHQDGPENERENCLSDGLTRPSACAWMNASIDGKP
jgi:hypothetical protein